MQLMPSSAKVVLKLKGIFKDFGLDDLLTFVLEREA